MRRIHRADMDSIMEPCRSKDEVTRPLTSENVSRHEIETIASRLRDIAIDLALLLSDIRDSHLGNDTDNIVTLSRCHFPGTPRVADLIAPVYLKETDGHLVSIRSFNDTPRPTDQDRCREFQLGSNISLEASLTSLPQAIVIEGDVNDLVRSSLKHTWTSLAEYGVHLGHMTTRRANTLHHAHIEFLRRGIYWPTLDLLCLLDILMLVQELTISDAIYQRIRQTMVPTPMRRSRKNDYEYMVARDFMLVVQSDSILFEKVLQILDSDRSRA
ncbi:uncharacterized protein LOC135491287 [Lineus longissimus]|uniref:uncharacterized protein LOC135491287 n=1 Tax=Lineus longissimus TaxID=88925 RepID=UPI00315D6EFE